jgi:hypothetical protein
MLQKSQIKRAGAMDLSVIVSLPYLRSGAVGISTLNLYLLWLFLFYRCKSFYFLIHMSCAIINKTRG